MVSNGKNTTTSVKRLVTEDGTDVTSPKYRADHLNNFFMNVGVTLASKYATDASKINFPVSEKPYTFSKIDVKSVDHIKNLKNGKATGLDGIATRILKAGKIYNYSLETGYLPKCWKMNWS